MERKTIVTAENGQQDLMITREFDLPVELLFKAYADPDLFAQWMGTTPVHYDGKKHGSYQIQTRDPQGNIAFQASGVFHDFVENKKITRTFEMENAPFGVQLEFITFEPITSETSKLIIHSVYSSGELRDQMLQLPFKQGLNMAHNRLQEIVGKLK